MDTALLPGLAREPPGGASHAGPPGARLDVTRLPPYLCTAPPGWQYPWHFSPHRLRRNGSALGNDAKIHDSEHELAYTDRREEGR